MTTADEGSSAPEMCECLPEFYLPEGEKPGNGTEVGGSFIFLL